MENTTFRPLEAAAARFVAARGQGFWDYFGGRGLRKETLDEFQVGFSPRYPLLATPANHLDAFLEAGFFCRRSQEEGQIVPNFRGMFSFPYRTTRGITCFTFRDAGISDLSDEDIRYLTLPATPPNRPLKHPPHHIARPAFYERPGSSNSDDEVTVVEAPISALRCAQAKLPTPLAASGLGFRDEALLALLERPRRVNLWLDWDPSGRRRMLQTALKALRLQREAAVARSKSNHAAYPGTLYVVVVDPRQVGGKDPADLNDDQTIRQVFEACRCPALEFAEKQVRDGLDATDPWQRRIAQQFLDRGGYLAYAAGDPAHQFRRRRRSSKL